MKEHTLLFGKPLLACGFSPRAAQRRCTCAGDPRVFAAIVHAEEGVAATA